MRLLLVDDPRFAGDPAPPIYKCSRPLLQSIRDVIQVRTVDVGEKRVSGHRATQPSLAGASQFSVAAV